MITAWRLAACLLALGSALAARAAGFDLVSAAEAAREAQAEAAAPAQTRARGLTPARTDAPAIRVIEPHALDRALVAPLRIELAFTPAPGSRVVPDSFRVLYGLLKIDLTDRLRAHAEVSERGAVIDQARVPQGQHRFFLQIGDDHGHVGERELRLRVGPAS